MVSMEMGRCPVRASADSPGYLRPEEAMGVWEDGDV